MYRSFEGSIYTLATPVLCIYDLGLFGRHMLYILPPNFLYSPSVPALYHSGFILSSSSNSERIVVRIVMLRITLVLLTVEVVHRLCEELVEVRFIECICI